MNYRAILRIVLVGTLFSPVLATPALSQDIDYRAVQWWQTYGAPAQFESDDDVPGEGALKISKTAMQEFSWSSGARIPVSQPLAQGERLTALVWARSAVPVTIPLQIQGSAPDYSVLATKDIALDATWRCHVISGTAPNALAGGSQSLTIQTGYSEADISLGPVAFLEGELVDAEEACHLSGFRPSEVAKEIHFASGSGPELAGTLHMPTGPVNGKVPVVILLGGNGDTQRGLYPLLIDRLARSGIATLDYDKRGTGRSTGEFIDSIELMTQDAQAAIKWVRSQEYLDPGEVAVVGTSQGGVVVANLGAADHTLAGIVMLSGPAGEKGKLFVDALQQALVKGGMREDAIEGIISAAIAFLDLRASGGSDEQTSALAQKLRDAFVSGGASPTDAERYTATLGSETAVSQYRAAPNDAMRSLASPILAIYGRDDSIVIAEQALPHTLTALQKNDDATIVALPGIDHFMNRPSSIQSQAFGRPIPLVSDAQVLELINAWLAERLVHS